MKKRKPIPKVSKKRSAELVLYKKQRIEFLSRPENEFCFIDGCNRRADTIEHTHGRIGNNFLDTSTWRPCCWKHNLELETNIGLSKKYQCSKITGKPKNNQLKP